MNAKTALCLALLEGRVLTVMNAFSICGYTNLARELPRLIEVPFGVLVSRTPRTGKNRYGGPVSYTEYRLNQTKQNLPGIEKIREYCRKELALHSPKTDKQAKEYKQLNLYLNL